MEHEKLIYALADEMFQTIPILYRRILRPDATGMSPFSPMISVLVIVKKQGPISMSSIAQALSYSKQYLTKIVDKLVAEGYVERIPDVSDRRVMKIGLTEDGKTYMARRRKRMRDRLAGDLSHLSDDELEYLYETFERVKVTLPKLLPDIRSE